MAAEAEVLSQLVILKPPSLFSDYEYKFSPEFQLLKAWESPLPIPLFLTTHAHSVKAVLSSSSSPITSDILRRLPSLQLVVATSVGLDQIDIPACRHRGISIANAGKVLSEDCADLAVGLFVDVLRKISAGDRFVRSSLWPVQNDFALGSKRGSGSEGGALVQCPLCEINISDLSEELRQVHTNGCLDRVETENVKLIDPHDRVETENVLLDGDRGCQAPQLFINGSLVHSHQKLVDSSPVIEWIHSLGLGRYEEVFIKEEIDWDTLQWLTEEGKG